MDVRGKPVLVTGAGRGIGRALAAYFAAKTANLALLDMNEPDLQETAALCTLEGVTARCYVANAADASWGVSPLRGSRCLRCRPSSPHGICGGAVQNRKPSTLSYWVACRVEMKSPSAWLSAVRWRPYCPSAWRLLLTL